MELDCRGSFRRRRLGDDALRPRGRGGRLGRVRVRELVLLAGGLDRAPSRCAGLDPRRSRRARPGRSPSPATPPSSSDSLQRELQAEADAEREAAARDRAPQRLVEARALAARPSHSRPTRRLAGRPDRRPRCPRGARHAHLGAEPPEGSDDRADVARAVVADGDVHTWPFVDGSTSLSSRTAARRGATDCLERRLGDVVLVAAGRLDVDREPSRLGEGCAACARRAPDRARGGARTPAGRRDRRRPRERVVHRHDRVAVAGDSAAVAERAVERLSERERRVLGRVVRAGLEVADAVEREVEAGMESELLEQVVVEPGAGLSRARGPLRRGRAGRGSVVSAVARTCRARRAAGSRGAGDGRSSARASASSRRSSSSRSRIDHADPVREDAHDQAFPRGAAAPELLRVVDRDEEEVRRATEAARARARRAPARSARAPRPARLTSGGSRERGERECRRDARDRLRRLAAVELGSRLRVGERVPDARAREAERLREGAQDDDAVVDRGPTAVSPAYSKYASSTTSGRAAGSGRDAPVGLFGRQQNVTAGESSPTSAPASAAATLKSG